MDVTVLILPDGRVALVLPAPLPVPIVPGEAFPATWLPQPGTGDPPHLLITFAPAASSATA